MFFCVFCVVFMFPIVSKKKKLDSEVGGWCLTNPSFSRIFIFFFNLTKPLRVNICIMAVNP